MSTAPAISAPGPTAFADVAGHEGAVRILDAALKTGRVPHALLFHGPSGVGKGDVAHRLARALLCTGDAARPCGACAACGRTQRDHAYDLLHIRPDGTRIKVEQIRELTELMHVGTGRGVAIIDPADALMEQAANALLKTLEEPPAGWVLVLVTARPDVLLATIRSRCQLVRFSRLSDADTAARLIESGVPKAQAGPLARLAQGAPGAVLNTGMDADELLNDYAGAVAALAPEALASPTRLIRSAETWGRDLDTTIRFLRWAQVRVSDALFAGTSAGEQTDPWAGIYSPDFLCEFSGLLQETESRLTRNINRQSAIEALLVRLRDEARPAPRKALV